MIVFSNTTPFISLSCIHRLDLLPKIFGTIHVAQAVVDECAEGGKIVVPLLAELEWVDIVPDTKDVSLTILFELDRGEKQTILLAREYKADIVIVDERLGRNIAEYLGLAVTGTLGVLAKAKQLGHIESFRDTARFMQEQGIHYNTSLIDRIAYHMGE
ncbi:DUF3368 domain-containing protein [Desulfonatronum parangueonense]